MFYSQDIQEPEIDWDVAADYGLSTDNGVVVPEIDSPLTEEQQSELQLLLAQHFGNADTKGLYLLCREYVYSLSD